MPTRLDYHLLDALTKAYTARAKLFQKGIHTAKVDLLIAEIDAIDHTSRQWNKKKLGISDTSFKRVKKAGGLPHQVFAHPDIIIQRPHLIAYYRNLATISKKGISQILFSTNRFESGERRDLKPDDALRMCIVFNQIMSGVIDDIADYSVEVSRKAILAEVGAQLQGTWVNLIGQGATKAVEDLLNDYVTRENIGSRVERSKLQLHNGWSIIFGSEPDVAFFDSKGMKQIAIEIKGSPDVAGAQTRYGEAKKSFAKQITENPRCHTIYLASCFTDAVIEQIRADGQVRDWFNLTSILYDENERSLFFSKIFHIVNTPT